MSLSQAVQLIGERTVNGVQDLENFGGVEVSDCIVVSAHGACMKVSAFIIGACDASGV